ncbi:hypothetical protein IWQ60_011317, partial [Tieghemiomyces parasiticus]
MITPRFRVTQDDTSVEVVIEVPHLRAQDIDLHVQDFQLRFYARPYFLRLTFPGRLVEDDQSKARYQVDEGELVLKVSKVVPGEHFSDLDLLSKLLATQDELKQSMTTAAGASGAIPKGPLIQVLDTPVNDPDYLASAEDALDEAEDGDETFDWEIPQTVPESGDAALSSTPNTSLTGTAYNYGFNNAYRHFFTHVQEVGNEVNVLHAPETTAAIDRHREQQAAEDAKFDPEYYLAEYFADSTEDGAYALRLAALDYETQWEQCYSQIRRQARKALKATAATSSMAVAETASEFPALDPTEALSASLDTLAIQPASPPAKTAAHPNDEIATPKPTETRVQVTESLPALITQFSDAEQALMRALPRKEYLLDASIYTPRLYLGLVDLVFAYSYDFRTNQGESSVESAWTVGALSALCSALDLPMIHPVDASSPTGASTTGITSPLHMTVIGCFRRALAYPLHRHWEVCVRVLHDTILLFKLGQRAILKVLLALKDLFDHHDTYYVYSKIWLDDYCVWLQRHADPKAIQALARELEGLTIAKSELGWELEALEERGYVTTASEYSDSSEGEASSESSDDDATSEDSDVEDAGEDLGQGSGQDEAIS